MNRQTPKAFVYTVVGMAAMTVVTACSGLLESEQPAKRYYMLQPVADAPPSHDIELELSVVPGLDTDRIQGLAGDASLHRYENARWPDHLPEVLESVMQRSLATPDAASDDHWKVEIQVQEFFGRMNGSGETHTVTVKMAGTIHCGQQSHPVKLDATPRVGSQNLASIVAAHQSGLDDVTRQLLTKSNELCG